MDVPPFINPLGRGFDFFYSTDPKDRVEPKPIIERYHSLSPPFILPDAQAIEIAFFEAYTSAALISLARDHGDVMGQPLMPGTRITALIAQGLAASTSPKLPFRIRRFGPPPVSVLLYEALSQTGGQAG